MSTFLIVVLGVLGFLALVIGFLGWLFFHQGGCCVKKTAAKISRKCAVYKAGDGPFPAPGRRNPRPGGKTDGLIRSAGVSSLIGWNMGR
ncbi:MAG: hypothetical protein IT188_03805 [Acidobacteria bacterium]|nr:hypothetical protein [Acidobacteriota bacterium]